ncbi:MAG: hypothetical protein RLW87_20925 [Alphaproteobacteria bacterium]
MLSPHRVSEAIDAVRSAMAARRLTVEDLAREIAPDFPPSRLHAVLEPVELDEGEGYDQEAVPVSYDRLTLYQALRIAWCLDLGLDDVSPLVGDSEGEPSALHLLATQFAAHPDRGVRRELVEILRLAAGAWKIPPFKPVTDPTDDG